MKPVSKSHCSIHSVFLYRKRERTSGNTNDDYETIAVLGPNEDTYFDTSINVKAGYKYKEVIELGVAAQITLHFRKRTSTAGRVPCSISRIRNNGWISRITGPGYCSANNRKSNSHRYGICKRPADSRPFAHSGCVVRSRSGGRKDETNGGKRYRFPPNDAVGRSDRT